MSSELLLHCCLTRPAKRAEVVLLSQGPPGAYRSPRTLRNGRPGQCRFMSRQRCSRLARRLVASAICGMIGVAVAGPALSADTYDGAYAGTRVLTKGPDQTCPAKEDVSVTVHGDTLTFTNGS